MITIILNNVKRKEHEYMVYRLTRPFKYVISLLCKLQGSAAGIRNDSNTPWDSNEKT